MRSFLMHIADSNLVVTNPYDGQNCFDVGSFKPGHGDGYWNNTCIIMGCRNPTCVDKVTSVSQCDPSIVTLKDNRYYTTHGACLPAACLRDCSRALAATARIHACNTTRRDTVDRQRDDPVRWEDAVGRGGPGGRYGEG